VLVVLGVALALLGARSAQHQAGLHRRALHGEIGIGLAAEDARSSIRFSLGRSNTPEQVDALVEAVAESVAHLRRIAPVRVHA